MSPIAEGLRAAGLSVWIDRDTSGGARWRQEILEHLEGAACVLVVWSETSVGPDAGFVHDEASRGLRRGVLLPVRVDPVEPPLGFGEVQVLDLVGWRGRRADPRFEDVVAATRAIVEGEPRSSPRSPSRRRRRIAGLGTAAIGLATWLGFVADVAGLQGAVCRVPGMRTVCGAAGWGGVPSRAEEELWASRRPGDCEALRDYLGRFPDGAYAARAQRLLQAAATGTEELWVAAERRLPLTVRVGGDPQATEAEAREAALSRGRDDARLVCGGFQAPEFRLLAATPVADRWRCPGRDGGVLCGFDGVAVCELEERRLAATESCP